MNVQQDINGYFILQFFVLYIVKILKKEDTKQVF